MNEWMNEVCGFALLHSLSFLLGQIEEKKIVYWFIVAPPIYVKF